MLQANQSVMGLSEFDEARDELADFIVQTIQGLDEALRANYAEQDRGNKEMSEIREQIVHKFIKSLEKQAKAIKLQKIIKIVTIVMCALCVVTPLVAATPFALAQALVAVAFLCSSPVMDDMIQKFIEELGPIAGPIVGMVIMLAMAMVSAQMLGRMISRGVATYAAAQASAQTASTSTIAALKESLILAIKNNFSAPSVAAVEKFTLWCTSLMGAAASGMQAAQGVFSYEATKFMANANLDQSLIDEMSQLLEMLESLANQGMSDMQAFQQSLASIYAQNQ